MNQTVTVTKTPIHEGTWSYEVHHRGVLVAVCPVNYHVFNAPAKALAYRIAEMIGKDQEKVA